MRNGLKLQYNNAYRMPSGEYVILAAMKNIQQDCSSCDRVISKKQSELQHPNYNVVDAKRPPQKLSTYCGLEAWGTSRRGKSEIARQMHHLDQALPSCNKAFHSFS